MPEESPKQEAWLDDDDYESEPESQRITGYKWTLSVIEQTGNECMSCKEQYAISMLRTPTTPTMVPSNSRRKTPDREVMSIGWLCRKCAVSFAIQILETLSV